MEKERQPALFIGHGSPMNAIADNAYARTLRAWGDKLRESKPRAAIVFSAHWETDGLQVLTAAEPRTIHDFYGFPRALFEVSYPAMGEPALADRVLTMLQNEAAVPTTQWGFDHGVWSVMRHLWPKADLPIVMVSLARRLDPETHFRVGELLKPLRDEGVLFLGSGNIVHNLKEIQWDEAAAPFPWATEFDARIKAALETRDEKTLISASRASDLASRKSVPTREHYLPMIPILGATYANEKPLFISEEIQNASLSMRSMVYGYNGT
ncbi:4,5-DOPA dioxygenase extradiol [soil metagenome]